MGCGISKQSTCRHCQAPYDDSYSSITKSFSMNVHHPPVNKGDTYHVVALTSSTLGSINLDPPSNFNKVDTILVDDSLETVENRNNYDVGIDKNEEIVSKTPIMTPLGELETIDVQDLMEGLEEKSSFRHGEHAKSFSFHVSDDSIPPLFDSDPRTMSRDEKLGSGERTRLVAHEKENVLPNWGSDSMVVSNFDPEVISEFKKVLENKTFDMAHDREQDVGVIKTFEETGRKFDGTNSTDKMREEKMIIGDVIGKKMVNEYGFVQKFDNGIVSQNGNVDTSGYQEKETTGMVVENGNINVNSGKEKLVLYFTSLRGVRKTYEDCCYVRYILKGLRVRVDERDVSMHSGFKEELRELLGYGFKGGLPKVFVGERYIGGVEEIRRMNEDGELYKKVLQGCEMLEDDGRSNRVADVCEGCGDIRFIPCETCSGSCKLYYEFEEFEEDEYGFQRCPDCNENGLIRCPICCY